MFAAGEDDNHGGIEDASRYAEHMKRFGRILYRSILKDLTKLRISGNYLEAGAGPGIFAVMLAEANPSAKIICLDISRDMVEVGRRYVEEQGLAGRIRFVIGDVGDGGVLAQLGKFDLVYSTFSMHHWDDVKRSLLNLWKVVKDGGVLYIADFRRVWWIDLVPFGGGLTGSIKISLTKPELEKIASEINLSNYQIKERFPFFLSLTARKDS